MWTNIHSIKEEINEFEIKCILERRESRSSCKRNKTKDWIEDWLNSIPTVCWVSNNSILFIYFFA